MSSSHASSSAKQSHDPRCRRSTQLSSEAVVRLLCSSLKLYIVNSSPSALDVRGIVSMNMLGLTVTTHVT